MRAAVAGLLLLALAQVSCHDGDNRPSGGLQQPVGGRCLNSGDQVERAAVVEFFAAFNAGSVGRAERVAQLTELWDPVGTAYRDALRPALESWVASGHRVHDRISVIVLCVYPGQGAEGELLRRNDVLASAGMPSLQQSVKVRTEGRLLRQIVLYPPDGESREAFCGRFGPAVRAAAAHDPDSKPCPD